MEQYARHMQVFGILIEHMTGKLVHEKQGKTSDGSGRRKTYRNSL